MKKVVITQSNYIPWKGYFDAIALADACVIYDDMQYTKRDWRNRNLLKTPHGLKWLTIPVEVKGKYFQKIKDTKVSDPKWHLKHWEFLKQNYKNAKCYHEAFEYLEMLYKNVNSVYLTDINIYFLEGLCHYLGIEANFKRSSEFDLKEDRNERLLHICKDLGATAYFSGPAAKSYMDESIFKDASIDVNYLDYSGYEEYNQLFPPFEHGVSILDLIFSEGEHAKDFLKNN